MSTTVFLCQGPASSLTNRHHVTHADDRVKTPVLQQIGFVQRKRPWQCLQAMHAEHACQLQSLRGLQRQSGCNPCPTDLSELGQMLNLVCVRGRSDGSSNIVALLEQLFDEFGPDKAASTRNNRSVRTFFLDWGHGLRFNQRAVGCLHTCICASAACKQLQHNLHPLCTHACDTHAATKRKGTLYMGNRTCTETPIQGLHVAVSGRIHFGNSVCNKYGVDLLPATTLKHSQTCKATSRL